MNEKAKQYYAQAEESGILVALAPFGSSLQVSIPMMQSLCEQPIEELNLSVRSYNGLKRCGVHTVNDVCNMIMSENGLAKIRNIGRKSIGEIKTAMLVQGYNRLSQKSKMEFWEDFITNNEVKIAN